MAPAEIQWLLKDDCKLPPAEPCGYLHDSLQDVVFVLINPLCQHQTNMASGTQYEAAGVVDELLSIPLRLLEYKPLSAHSHAKNKIF